MKKAQKIFKNAVSHMWYTFDNVQIWDYIIEYSRRGLCLFRETKRIWVIVDWVVYINSFIEKFRFNMAIKNNIQSICDFYENIIKSKEERIKNKEKEASDLKEENTELKEKIEDLENKLSNSLAEKINADFNS